MLAAANSVFGRWDDAKGDENIDFMPTILSRFDMIFIIKDEHDENRDMVSGLVYFCIDPFFLSFFFLVICAFIFIFKFEIRIGAKKIFFLITLEVSDK